MQVSLKPGQGLDGAVIRAWALAPARLGSNQIASAVHLLAL